MMPIIEIRRTLFPSALTFLFPGPVLSVSMKLQLDIELRQEEYRHGRLRQKLGKINLVLGGVLGSGVGLSGVILGCNLRYTRSAREPL